MTLGSGDAIFENYNRFMNNSLLLASTLGGGGGPKEIRLLRWKGGIDQCNKYKTMTLFTYK